jgi:hypothetical protein
MSRHLGQVSFFGLDEFGRPAGLHPAFGAGGGAAIQAGAAWATRHLWPAQVKWSEAIGAGVAAVVGAGLMIPRYTRGAGMTAIATALAGGVVRTIELMTLPELPTVPVAGYGLTTMERSAMVGMQGYGITTVEPQSRVGMQGAGDPAQLLGAPIFADGGIGQNPAAAAAQLLGVTGISGLGGRFGATVFGGN